MAKMAYIGKWIYRAEQRAKHSSHTPFVKAVQKINKINKKLWTIQQHVYRYVFKKQQPGPIYPFLYCTVLFFNMCLYERCT